MKTGAVDWEEIARREPYVAVLTDEGALRVAGNREATVPFFETGEADIASLLATIAALLEHEVPLQSVLDFGCGVGRLTLPLARRATRVVACDIAPTMLMHARENAAFAGLENVTLMASEELLRSRGGQFDFICSLLVLEHIPPSEGHEIIRRLLGLLAPGGIAALHLTFERRGGRLRRFARAMRARSALVPRTIGANGKDRLRLPDRQRNEYRERIVDRDVRATEAKIIGRFSTQHGEATGAVLVIQKPTSAR